ncbi:unnamed protein product [Cylicocyclus nassatus]|uniref:Uncharacterized protein n=1 Tax=Cylicocyclus nassatus TaxID=53992 RepID=A0AA36DMN3_CYLNA|nr:unnamed protein product [Cylicocyclus nassatus]
MAKKQSTKLPSIRKKQLVEEIAHFVDDHQKEAEKRRKELTEKVDELYLQLRNDLFEAVKSVLSENVLSRNLYDFLNAPPTEGSVKSADDVPTGSSASSGDVKMKLTEVEAASVAAEQMDFGMKSVFTPLQENSAVLNMPSVIRPKLDDVRRNQFRAARDDELAFSVDGSPIVVLPADADPETRVFKQMMQENGDTFSPQSREVLLTFKNLLRQKVEKANTMSQKTE